MVPNYYAASMASDATHSDRPISMPSSPIWPDPSTAAAPMRQRWIQRLFPKMPNKIALLDPSEVAIIVALMDLNARQGEAVFCDLDSDQEAFIINLPHAEIFGRTNEKAKNICTFTELSKDYGQMIREEVLLDELDNDQPALPSVIRQDYAFIKATLGLIYRS